MGLLIKIVYAGMFGYLVYLIYQVIEIYKVKLKIGELHDELLSDINSDTELIHNKSFYQKLSFTTDIATVEELRFTLAHKYSRTLKKFYTLESSLSFFVILGLLGTVLGLSGAVAQISSAMRHGTSLTNTDLSGPLGSISDAYGTTIAGTVGVIIGTVVKIVVHNQLNIPEALTNLEIDLSKFLLKIGTFAPPLEIQFKTFMQEWNQNMLNDFGQIIKSSFKEGISDFTESIAEMNASVKSSVEALVNIPDTFENSLRALQESSSTIERFGENVHNLSAELSLVVQQFTTISDSTSQQLVTIDSLGNLLSKTTSTIELVSANIEITSNKQQDLLQVFSQRMEALENQMSGLEEELSKSSTTIHQLVSTQGDNTLQLKELSSNFSTIDNSVEALTEMLERNQETYSHLGKSIESLGSQMTQSSQQVEEEGKAIVNELAGLEQVFSSIDTSYSGITENIESFKESNKLYVEAIDSLQKVLTQNSNIGDSLLKLLSESDKTINKQITMQEKLASMVNGIGTIETSINLLQSAAENFGDNIESFDGMIAKLEKAIQNSTSSQLRDFARSFNVLSERIKGVVDNTEIIYDAINDQVAIQKSKKQGDKK